MSEEISDVRIWLGSELQGAKGIILVVLCKVIWLGACTHPSDELQFYHLPTTLP